MLSVKQGGIKYHFLSLWYDSTWDWTHVSRAIGEHSNRFPPLTGVDNDYYPRVNVIALPEFTTMSEVQRVNPNATGGPLPHMYILR